MSKKLFCVCLALFPTAQWVGMTLCTIFCLLRTCFCSLFNNLDNLCVSAIHTNAIDICSFILKKIIEYTFDMQIKFDYRVISKISQFQDDFQISQFQDDFPNSRCFRTRIVFRRKVIPICHCVVCIYTLNCLRWCPVFFVIVSVYTKCI